jgi:phenylalanyl-tRNA synthetase beta chain
LAALRRNLARGVGSGVALFETGLVYLPNLEQPLSPPRLGVDRRPTDDELAAVLAALPNQPLHLAVALAGERRPGGWWGPGRAAGWADAVQAVRDVAHALRLELQVSAADQPPWHPGRCAAVAVDGVLVGHAGELHPRACAALDLPPRTCAAEVNLAELLAHVGDPVQSVPVSPFPVATQDVALVVTADVPAAAVAEALRAGAGELLESLRLFDVFTGDQVGEGRRSLAYALRFRAPDRTLTSEEVNAARDAAVAEAGRRVGAVLRG